MAKIPANHGKQWTQKEIHYLQNLTFQNIPTQVIALKLVRTEEAFR